MWKTVSVVFYMVVMVLLFVMQVVSPTMLGGWIPPLLMVLGALGMASAANVAEPKPEPGKGVPFLVGVGLVLRDIWLEVMTGEQPAEAHAAIAMRADRQHEQFCAGDPHGFYGDKLPPPDLMRPELRMLQEQQKQHERMQKYHDVDRVDRVIGGDPRDRLYPRVAQEAVRMIHLQQCTNLTGRASEEALAIYGWLKEQARQHDMTLQEFLAFTEQWVSDYLGFEVKIGDVVAV